MPFAQVHYPFENAEWFESHFPADFIVEYVGPDAGLVLHAARAVDGAVRPTTFRHCVSHGIVLGDDGRKMSKRLGNYPEPDMVFDMWGADAMRWFLLSSPILRGQDLVVHAKGIEEAVRQVLNPIWNTWYFLSLYANVDGIRGEHRTDATGVLDRYILAKTAALVADVTASHGRLRPLRRVRVDRLVSRRPHQLVHPAQPGPVLASRDGSADGRGRQDRRLRHAVDRSHDLCRVTAPLLPLLTESVYQGLTGERSVHLADWPSLDELPADPDLVEAMDLVREVCSAAHAIRKESGKRLRLPLRKLTVAGPRAHELADYVDLIDDEVNVKQVVLTSDTSVIAQEVLTIVPAAIGPRLGAETQKVIAAVKRGDWTRAGDGTIEAAGVSVREGEYTLVLHPSDEHSARALTDGAGVVSLDLETTKSSSSRDSPATSCASSRRRGATQGFTSRTASISGSTLPEAMAVATEHHRAWVMEQTLAVDLEVTAGPSIEIDLSKAT